MKENFEEQPLVILHGGFAVKFCPCDPDQVKYSLDTGYFLLPGIVVNGYHIDETTDKYYIECFLFIPRSETLHFIFNGEFSCPGKTPNDDSFVISLRDFVQEKLCKLKQKKSK